MKDVIHSGDAKDTVIPVVRETPTVHKRTVQTGGVRVEKTVAERDVIVDEPTSLYEVRVERVEVGRDLEPGEAVPAIRHEADTMIVPIVHEVPVVTRKLVLVEELHITRIQRQVHRPQTVRVKEETVSVSELTAADIDDSTAAAPSGATAAVKPINAGQ